IQRPAARRLESKARDSSAGRNSVTRSWEIWSRGEKRETNRMSRLNWLQRSKVPNPKFQAQEKLQAPITNLVCQGLMRAWFRGLLGRWCLGILWFLELARYGRSGTAESWSIGLL